MGVLDDASGVTRVTLTVFESVGMLIVTLALGASLTVAFGIGRMVERAFGSSARPTSQDQTTTSRR